VTGADGIATAAEGTWGNPWARLPAFNGLLSMFSTTDAGKYMVMSDPSSPARVRSRAPWEETTAAVGFRA
jgi:hypothetical protein